MFCLRFTKKGGIAFHIHGPNIWYGKACIGICRCCLFHCRQCLFLREAEPFFQRQSKGQTCGMGRHTLESVGVAYLTAGNVFLKRSRACFFRGNASLVKVMPFSPTVKTFSLLLIRRHCLLCQRYWLFPQWQGLYLSLYPIVNACFAEGSSYSPVGKAFFD